MSIPLRLVKSELPVRQHLAGVPDSVPHEVTDEFEPMKDADIDARVGHYAALNSLLEDQVGSLTRRCKGLETEVEELRDRLELASRSLAPPPRGESGRPFVLPQATSS